jgi:Amt family ammonium transporter
MYVLNLALPTDQENGFIGTKFFFATELPENDGHIIEARWFFYWTFCTASTTIVSGGVAGRAKFQTYLGYTVFMSIWVFALPCHCTFISLCF